MLNFSQSINSSSIKNSMQRTTFPLIPLSFKITQPKSQNPLKQMTTQQSINICSDSANSIFHKNMTRSYSREKLQDQYISFKLKPALKESKQNPVRISKDQKTLAIIPNRQNRQVADFYFPHFLDESQQYHKKNSLSQLSKSPQFFCKPNSIDSIKESFQEQKQRKNYNNNNRKTYNDENSFCKLMNMSEEFHALKKYQNPSREYQKQTNRKQFQIQPNFDQDSVIYDNFEDYELYTPYKELKEQFQRQQKLYEKEVKLNQHHQFDSFSQKSSDPFKDIPITFNNQQGQLESRDNKIVSNVMKSKQKMQSDQSNQKKSFFFLTNPSIETHKKYLNSINPTHIDRNIQSKKNTQEKHVQQFCFSLSSIKLTNQNSLEQPYVNKNLFSNSNDDQLLFFESRNNSKQLGSFGCSKKVHIKQLVQEFVGQLDNLDENSLNQKNVHELEDVLESIVFKQSFKTKRQPILIQQENNYSARTRSPIINEAQTKKWQKIKRQNSSDIATERKALSQFQPLDNNKMISQKRQSRDSFDIVNSSSNKYSEERKYVKSPTSSHKKSPSLIVGKQNIKKQSVYKPNFALFKSREKNVISQQKQKQNQKTCTAFTHLKQKQEISPININPKSSIYVNKKSAKSSRQHLRTEAHRPGGWRVY